MSFSRFPRRIAIAVLVLLGACTEPTAAPLPPLDASYAKAAPTNSPTVTSTAPSEAPRDTTLDVQINGSGFDKGSVAAFTLGGVLDGRVRVNSTRYVKSTQVVANVTIDADAIASMYDVAVTTSGGKKGIGTELFAVELRGELLTRGVLAYGVNTSGVISGQGSGTASCSVTPVPYLWNPDGSRIDLPLAPGYCAASTKAINQSGVVLGPLFYAGGSEPGLWTPSGSGYTVQVLSRPSDGVHVTAVTLNDAGDVIGWSEQSTRLFWRSASTGWLPVTAPAGATACQLQGLNNLGAIVGQCSSGAAYEGYYWADHNALPIKLPRSAPTGDVHARAINDDGVIVGDASGRAVKWTPSGGSFTVSVLPDLGAGVAVAIASDGSAVGALSRAVGFPSPALWSPDGRLTLLQTSKGADGEALGVSITPTGIVIAGYQQLSGKQAMRWRVPQ